MVYVLAVAITNPALAADWPQSTCINYIRALDLSAKYNDPYLNQFYLDVADEMYGAINRTIASRGMAPLLIAKDAEAQAQRGMRVVEECKRDMGATYAEAVTAAYIAMRKAQGLSVELPNK